MERKFTLNPAKAVRRPAALALVVAAIGLSILAGCGSDDDDESTSTAGSSADTSTTAKTDKLAPVMAALEKARGVPKFTPAGPAFDASAAKGKTVMFLSVILTVPAQQFEWEGTKAAADAAGVKAIKYDAKGTNAGAVQGIQQAISQKVDALIIDAVPSASIEAPIKKAMDAGIKVIVTQNRNEATGGPEVDTGNGTVAFPFNDAAKLEADWVLADSGGKDINAVTFSVPGDLAHGDMVDTINQEIKKYAPDAKIRNEKVLGPDWATRLPTLTRSLMTKDPSINYMIPVVDGQALFIVPALRQIGKQDQVKITGFNGTPAVMKMLKAGNVVGSDIGASFVWQGWANMDQALRALTGQEPAKNAGAPLRLFDETNIDEIDINAAQQGAEWYDTEAATQEYLKLWGLS